MPSVAAAARRLPFRPVVLRSLGRPSRVYVQGPRRKGVYRAVAFSYRRFRRDWLHVVESLPGPQAVFRPFARDAARRDACGFDWRLVKLHDGPLALVIGEPDRLVVNFQTARVGFSMIASPVRSPERLLAVAADLRRAAGKH